jgi:hypothetical protein
MPTLAQKKLWANTLWPENQNVQKCHFVLSISFTKGKIKAMIINTTYQVWQQIENLPCNGKRHQFNIYKPAFSIKAHFLILSYQACKDSYKLVIGMAANWRHNFTFIKQHF